MPVKTGIVPVRAALSTWRRSPGLWRRLGVSQPARKPKSSSEPHMATPSFNGCWHVD